MYIGVAAAISKSSFSLQHYLRIMKILFATSFYKSELISFIKTGWFRNNVLSCYCDLEIHLSNMVDLSYIKNQIYIQKNES